MGVGTMSHSRIMSAMLVCVGLANALMSGDGDGAVAELSGSLFEHNPVARTLRAPLGGSLCVVESSRKRLRVRPCEGAESAVSLLQIDARSRAVVSTKGQISLGVEGGNADIALLQSQAGLSPAVLAQAQESVTTARQQLKTARAQGGRVLELAQNQLEQTLLKKQIVQVRADKLVRTEPIPPAIAKVLPYALAAVQAKLHRVQATGHVLLAKLNLEKATTPEQVRKGREELKVREEFERKAVGVELSKREEEKKQIHGLPKAQPGAQPNAQTVAKSKTASLLVEAKGITKLQEELVHKQIEESKHAEQESRANATVIVTTMQKEVGQKSVARMAAEGSHLKQKQAAVIASTEKKAHKVKLQAAKKQQHLSKQATEVLKADLQSVAKEKQHETKVLSVAAEQAASIVKQAEQKTADIFDHELAEASKEKSMTQHTEHEITAAVPPPPDREAPESVDPLSGNSTADLHSAYAGTNTIQASENRFICLQEEVAPSGAVTSIQYTECHKHADCVQTDVETKCVCREGFTGNGHSCSRVVCDALEPPQNGIVRCPSGTLMGSVCKTSCNFGYALKGPENSECRASGSWSHTSAQQQCERIQCKKAPKLESNVLKKCSGDRYGDQCELSCSPGYMLEGGTQLVCQAGSAREGVWRAPLESETRCVPLNCGALATPAGATVACQGEGTNRVCTVQCGSGFRQEGPVKHFCQADGHWSGGPVKCLALKCPVEAPPRNGHMTCSGNSVGDECQFSCKTNYRLIGGPNRQCSLGVQGSSVGAKWEGLPRRCEEVTCGVIQPIQHGTHSCNGDRVDHTCTFQCDPGFRMSGRADITCKADGQWSGETVKCVAAQCGKVVTPESGSAVCSGDSFGATCKFTCNHGFGLLGSMTRKCMEDGKWSGSMTSCKQSHCRHPPAVLNGHQVCTGAGTGSKCKVHCNPGYTLRGDTVRTCKADGSYSGAAAYCEATVCDAPSEPANGKVQCDGYRHKSACRFTCDPGYEPDGDSRTCNSQGKWSGKEVTCVPRTCGILKAPAAGSMKCDRTAFGGSCLFSCQPGYFVNEGGSERKCLPNGEWSGEPTVCTPLDCGAPRGESATFSCPHGTELGDSCQVHCKPGFSRPENAGTTICQQNGKWSGSLQCKPIRCQVPPTPQFGVMNCTGHTLGHQCVASCSEGFDLTGSPVRTCSENSQFSGSAAACKPVVCPIIKKPIGGSLICGSIKNGTADILGANLYGSSCSVRCNPGFVLQGSPTRNCRANGVWSGSVGLCKPTDCGEPSHIEGCKHSCPWGHSLGSKCEIQAMSGHVLKTTQPVIECLNTGAWSSGGAKCPPKKCDSAPEVSGGETACSQKSFVGSVCGLKCSPDMVRSGQVSKECKMDLSWSHGNMTCGRIPERATKLVLLGNHTPAFSLVSKVGSVSVRVEAAEKQKAYVALQSNTTASASKWLLGMLEDDNSFSICYGKVAKPNCAIEVQADGTVHFRGSVNFHDRVQHSPLINQDSQVAQVETASGQASLKQNPASASKSTQLGTAMSFQLSSEPRTEGLVQSIEDELSLLELGNGYSYTTSVSTGAKWVTHGGDIGIRIGSDNSIEGREAYAEFRSRDQLEAWGMGIRGDYGLHIGYGVAGKFKDTNSSLSVYNDKIEIKVNAVFHKKASYHQAGVVQLKLSESIPEAHKKTIELPNTLETSAIPDVPEFSNTTFFSSGSAEPLLTYSSDSETGISIEGNQQVFLELSNQVQNRWRLRVGPDQNLHMAYKGEGGNTASEKAPMILHKDGSIHFYQPVLFTGGTYRIA